MTTINIADFKVSTGVGFGTSGIRDLNEKLTDRTVYIYTKAFLSHCRDLGEFNSNSKVVIAGDLRKSTPRIMRAVAKGIEDIGGVVINCGLIPTPAVTYMGVKNNWQSIMITGSHIPDDRNGIKYNLAKREVLKSDEEAISNSIVEIDDQLFNNDGSFVSQYELPPKTVEAYNEYLERYLGFFDNNLLRGKRIGVWGHSAVGRDMYVDILQKLGAEVEKIEYSYDTFVPIDTDAVNETTMANMKKWDDEHSLDYVISTDGDGDRPLLTDEHGNQIRSELLPLFASKYLRVEAVGCTMTACTVAEKYGVFKDIIRTKVGSPYIVEAMIELQNRGYTRVAGYELNGGFLVGTNLELNGKKLLALPTRDALLPILATIALSIEEQTPLSTLVENLPDRFTYSSSIKGIPTDKSMAILANWEKYKSDLVEIYGQIVDVNLLDGLRLTFANGDIVHFRPSKNAPEFRDYTDSETYERAKDISDKAIELIKKWTEYTA
jgi:phosphomannomutase